MLSPITFIPAMDAITSQGFPDGSVVVTDIPRIWAIWSDGFCEWPAMAAMKSARREPEKKTANSLTGFMKSPLATRLQRMICSATALLRREGELSGIELDRKRSGACCRLQRNQAGPFYATNDEMRSPLLNYCQFQFVMHSS